MTEFTHEEEFLSHLTAGGVMAARLLRTAMGQAPGGDAPDVKALRAAGYREQTPYDEHLRRALGEQRWAKYVADPARVVCAALITDGAAAGHDMPALLAKAADIRAWEDDARSPARSIARVLAHRIKRELDRQPSIKSTNAGIRTNSGAPARPVPVPMPSTPWDDQLRDRLGDHRWQQYAGDERRRDIAALLTRAHAAGHDVPALITQAVSAREWEDDPTSPSRRVGGVLHYRLKAAIASSKPEGHGLPPQVADVVVGGIAPASGREGPARPDAAVRTVIRDTRQPPERGRD
jgi:hypothetical protein